MAKSPPRARSSLATPRSSKAAAASALTQARTRRDAGTSVAGEGDLDVAPVGGKATSKSEVWQARIGGDLAEQLRADAEVLGLDGRTEIVKAALELLHRRAAEVRMAQSVEDYHRGSTPPLPLGVTPPDASS